MLGKVIGKVAKKVGGFAKKKFQEAPVGKGIEAFRSYQAKRKSSAALPKPKSGIPTKIGEFDTGIDSNLKVPKVSSFQRQPLY